MSNSISPDATYPYIAYLKKERKYEGWMECLKRDIDGSNSHFILDITASGVRTLWPTETQAPALSIDLEKKKLTHGTRLIVFEPSCLRYVQDSAGIVYDIDPKFFRAAVLSCDQDGYYIEVRHGVPEFLVGGRPQHLDLGYGWVAVIHRRNDCNIVLVSTPKMRSPELAQHWCDGMKHLYRDHVEFFYIYLETVCHYHDTFYKQVHENPLLLLLPVLDIHAVYLYDGLSIADGLFREGRKNRHENPGLVEKAWSELRMMKHDGIRPLHCIKQYDSDHGNGKVRKFKEYRDLTKRFGYIDKEINRMEALARDYLQHHIGMFGLDESRASIKQAKVALEESKRTKLVTVLAIFFVPISLSTSIFGMNIHELNENGQSLWVFILTTVVVTTATMMLWGFMYQFQQYNSLPRDNARQERQPWRCVDV
ncbi:putative magnesium transport protein transmembrane region [Rosellinia necatrix]|uniref:Putative magnesium transport protein transmembrane region n=1 Tax=Rosellinia necatrix TaxID=77044 RepID=A0A1S7UIQ8_ROSNE|nr:putative magnesium transport protein transmembrane region [Rosellinia necatrix]